MSCRVDTVTSEVADAGYFVPLSEAQSFDGYTLVLPGLSIGNVGQLAIDVIIPTLNAPLVGYLDDPNVLPCVGNDAFTTPGSGVVNLSLEVFKDQDKKVAFLQQRAPVISGRNERFAQNLAQWISESKFKQVVLLLSTDAAYRTDSQLYGEQLRLIPSQKVEVEQFIPLNWLALEEDCFDNTLKRGTVSRKLWEKVSANIPFVVMVGFCHEGDNIPDGIQMATWVNNWLQLVEFADANTKKVNWILPSSWSAILQPPPVNPLLFGHCVCIPTLIDATQLHDTRLEAAPPNLQAQLDEYEAQLLNAVQFEEGEKADDGSDAADQNGQAHQPSNHSSPTVNRAPQRVEKDKMKDRDTSHDCNSVLSRRSKGKEREERSHSPPTHQASSPQSENDISQRSLSTDAPSNDDNGPPIRASEVGLDYFIGLLVVLMVILVGYKFSVFLDGSKFLG